MRYLYSLKAKYEDAADPLKHVSKALTKVFEGVSPSAGLELEVLAEDERVYEFRVDRVQVIWPQDVIVTLTLLNGRALGFVREKPTPIPV